MFVANEDQRAPSPELRRSGMSAETCLEHVTPTGVHEEGGRSSHPTNMPLLRSYVSLHTWQIMF